MAQRGQHNPQYRAGHAGADRRARPQEGSHCGLFWKPCGQGQASTLLGWQAGRKAMLSLLGDSYPLGCSEILCCCFYSEDVGERSWALPDLSRVPSWTTYRPQACRKAQGPVGAQKQAGSLASGGRYAVIREEHGAYFEPASPQADPWQWRGLCPQAHGPPLPCIRCP